MKRIQNWTIVCSDDPYLAPELRAAVVVGEVDWDEKKYIRTSQIASFSGRKFITHSGSEYELDGDPGQQFLDNLDKSGLDIMMSHPFAALHSNNWF